MKNIKHYKIVFIGGALDHTNLPFCEELYKYYKNDFIFIQTEKMYEDRKALNYKNTDTPSFVLDVESNKAKKKIIKDICFDTDILIYGGIKKRSYIRKRLRSNKIVFKLTEKFLKNVHSSIQKLRSFIGIFIHYYSFTQKNKFVLCMGGYVAHDLNKFKLFKNKRFVWGYFTEYSQLTYKELNDCKKENMRLLWVGRYVKEKNPFMIIFLAKFLKEKGIKCKINMVGYGPLENDCIKLTNELNVDDVVSFLGPLSLKEKEHQMNKANILLFPSNCDEGWGAVVNEAMGSGCLVIGSKYAGASSSLINDGKNGFLFDPNNQDNFNQIVLNSILNYEKLNDVRLNGYNTIHNEWNIKVATSRLISIFNSLLEKNNFDFFESGPCSNADKSQML